MNLPNLPLNWKFCPLAELMEVDAPIIYGILQPGADTPGGIPYVRPTEITDDQINVGSLRKTTTDIARRYSRASLKPGDVLLSIVGTIGKVAIVPPELDGANITQSSCRLRPAEKLLTSDFLAWFLRSPLARGEWDRIRLGTGVPRLNLAQVREQEMPVAPLNEQRRIVAKIEELTARSRRAREALEAVPPLLEQLRQSVLAAAFSGRLTADWREKNKDVEPASVLLERIRAERRRRWEENELAKLCAKGKEPKDDRWKAKYKEPDPVDTTGLPELPEGWCWASLEEFSTLITKGTTPTSVGFDFLNHGIRFVKVESLRDGRVSHEMCACIGQDADVALSRSRLQQGDVLFSIAGTLGRVAVVQREDIPANTNQAIAIIRPVYSEISPYIALALDDLRIFDFVQSARRGVGLYNLNLQQVSSIVVPLCPVQEQSEIIRSVQRALSSIEKFWSIENSSMELLETLNQSILAKAFCGELVPQDPDDEPASVLLERIRAQRAAAEAGAKKRKSSRPLRLLSQEENRKDAKVAKNPTDELQTVLNFIQTNPGPHSKQDILTHTNLDPSTWPTLAPQLANHPQIHRTGKRGGAKYGWRREKKG